MLYSDVCNYTLSGIEERNWERTNEHQRRDNRRGFGVSPPEKKLNSEGHSQQIYCIVKFVSLPLLEFSLAQIRLRDIIF